MNSMTALFPFGLDNRGEIRLWLWTKFTEKENPILQQHFSTLFPTQSLANHSGMFSLQPSFMPTHCMLDLPFLKNFGLVPNFLHPHNRTSHFHLAFKTSLALLGGRFCSSVTACKQIQCISTFLLSVRATQTKEIWHVEVLSIFLPVAGWKPFQVGFQLWNLFQDLIKDYFCWTTKKAVIFIRNLEHGLVRLLHFFSSFGYETCLWKYVSKFRVSRNKVAPSVFVRWNMDSVPLSTLCVKCWNFYH